MTDLKQRLAPLLANLGARERVVVWTARDVTPLPYRKHAVVTVAGGGMYGLALVPTSFAGRRLSSAKVYSRMGVSDVARAVSDFFPFMQLTMEIQAAPALEPRRAATVNPILREHPERDEIVIGEADAGRAWSLAPDLILDDAVTFDPIAGRAVFLRPNAADGVIRQVYNPDTVRAFVTRQSPYTRRDLRGGTDFLYVPLALLR